MSQPKGPSDQVKAAWIVGGLGIVAAVVLGLFSNGHPNPSPSPQPTPTPISPPNPPSQLVVKNCPNEERTGVGNTKEFNIDVPQDQIAFIDAYAFDGKENVFVTINGPYIGKHEITDGAICSGIPVNTNYEVLKKQRMSQLRKSFVELSLP